MGSRNDNSDLLKNIEIPIMFIVGKHDMSVSLKDSLSQIYLSKNSITQILDYCGHMGMYEQKKKTLEHVRNFVSYCYV